MKPNVPLSLSFEFFPPKTLEGMQNLKEAGVKLEAYLPDFYSVTFGAGGTTREGTVEAVKILQNNTSVMLTPHLACIASSKEEIVKVLASYQSLGVKRIVALRGDLPSGVGQLGNFRYACELVQLIRETLGDVVQIIVAAYPEMHPQASDIKADILNLKRKQDLGANSAITQYFYNADAYFYFLDKCQKMGVTLPIVPGIMPIINYTRLARFSDLCGAEIPRWIRCQLERIEEDTKATFEFGQEVIYNLCERLISGGAPGLHFYTLNKSEAAKTVIESLLLTHASYFACSRKVNLKQA